MKRTLLALALAASTLSLPLGGCSHRKDDGTAPTAGRSLPPLSIKDETPELMLTWIDDKGETHVELRPQDVPAAGRALVRVVLSDKEDGTRDLFYVADLDKKRDDGAYETRTLRRSEWEAEIEKRRDAYLARTAPPRPPPNASGTPAAPPAGQIGAATVIIYGASWCGPCHQAADFLKSKGIAYVLKDVETMPGAAAEMREKLSKIGRHGGSIPVIDVRGTILVGFNAAAIEQALARGPAGTAL